MVCLSLWPTTWENFSELATWPASPAPQASCSEEACAGHTSTGLLGRLQFPALGLSVLHSSPCDLPTSFIRLPVSQHNWNKIQTPWPTPRIHMIWPPLAPPSPDVLACSLAQTKASWLGLHCHAHPQPRGCHMAPSPQAGPCPEVTSTQRPPLMDGPA